MQDQEINGLSITRGVKSINHALFADETLLLGSATLSSASKFKATLDVFSKASGSTLNKNKCHIYSWNTLPRFLSAISRCLGFAASSSWTSFKYLGLPVFHKRLSIKDWHPQLEKFKSRIQTWGYRWLNAAGKSVLIKSVLSSLPLFHFAGLLTPMTILNKMDEFMCRLENIEVSDQLRSEWTTLLEHLHSLAPTQMRKKDQKGWGSTDRGYTVSTGYIKLNEKPHVPPDPAPWQGVWRIPTWPKINFFAWKLCHERILTYDILQRRGFHRPSICSLCKENSETAAHSILECKFSKQIWLSFIHNLNPNFLMPCSTVELFSNWAARYPGPPPKNQVIKTAWATLPKIICWQIWLEHNRRIFRSTNQNSKALEIKNKCQIKECLVDIKDDNNLSQQDITWGSLLDLQSQPAVRIALPNKNWQIQKSEDDFQDWLKSLSRHSLFFDGAAKGNPGKAGVGGVIVNRYGEKIHSFAWGLGHTTSIQAEALALFQGLKFLKDINIEESNVIGDSQIIINAMTSNSPVQDLKLARLISRIKSLGKGFEKLNYFHVLRALNKEADKEANKVALLSTGIKQKDKEESWDPIP
eukprot:PITA_01840